MKYFVRNIWIFFLLFLSFTNCRKEDTPADNRLICLANHTLSIPETSGLSFFSGEERLLTVSDSLGRVYIISTDGIVLDSLSYEGENPEDLAWDSLNHRIFIVEENSNEVVVIDTTGNELSRFKIAVGNQITKHGLEGITCNAPGGHLYIVSEKFPGRLYKTTPDGSILDSNDLSFAKDYSAVYYEPGTAKLWILSDESKSLILCDLSGAPEKMWETGVNDAEGLIVDIVAKRIFIVTDGDSRLLQFQLPEIR
ncbi:MAG: SdiA-regulated domain-containing protein [Bacteroidales bacterium]|nr:SdiA-regulated domain-containing protein [Bacteroidales bacterium]